MEQGIREDVSKRYSALQGQVEHWAYRIRKVCGDDHPFNERIRQKLVKYRPSYRTQVRAAPEPMSLERAIRFVAADPTEQAMAYIDLAVHEIDYSQRPPEGIAGAVIELIGPDASAALAVDRRYLLEALDDPLFERWVARQLVDHLRGQRAAMRKPKGDRGDSHAKG
jgi:hypothetical protein